MRLRMPPLAAVLAVPIVARCLCAQDLAGDWQGTLKASPQDLRVVLRIVRGGNGDLSASLFNITRGGDALRVSALTFESSVLKFSVEALRSTFKGELNNDGNSIAGIWSQGARPLELRRATKETAWAIPRTHSVQFVTTEAAGNVTLEVLDWGGTGRPLVLLAGLGNDAHIFDTFAPKLTSTFHVYGVTRRGYGASSAPDPARAENYTADRLGDDVLAVIAAVKLNRPVLIGHSIAGEELSSVGSRHPEKIAGLIYLDAGYSYAYYDPAQGDQTIDLLELRAKMEQLLPGKAPAGQGLKQLIEQILNTSLPLFERDLRQTLNALQEAPQPPPGAAAPPSPAASISDAILAGRQKYTEIRVPILAIFAAPHNPGPPISNDPAAKKAFQARDRTRMEIVVKAFESGIPSARVVRLPDAHHYVFLSNESDVLREVTAFLRGLP
jgi:non-heme chloroperoxidase